MSHPSDAFADILHPDVRAYVEALGRIEDPLLDALEAYGQQRGFPIVGRESGRWCELLARMVGGGANPRKGAGPRVFEFGSGFGYSAFFFARAAGPAGEVIGSEKDPWELEAFDRIYGDHPLRERIDLRLGDAFEVFARTEGDFDVVFIDIHKTGYVDALLAAVPRVRPGGLILADNVLWGGKTARPAAPDDASTAALQRFNRRIVEDPRLQSAILPACDGLAVCLRVA